MMTTIEIELYELEDTIKAYVESRIGVKTKCPTIKIENEKIVMSWFVSSIFPAKSEEKSSSEEEVSNEQ